MNRSALISGCLFAALSVVLGAFAAHGLKQLLAADQLAVFETGVRYQFYHSFALLIAGVVSQAFPGKALKIAVNCFIAGVILFSGSLYAMSLLSIKGVSLGPIGIVTPIGGLFFIIGWLSLMVNVMSKRSPIQ
jgi:uncharacterized membrane protein YgdD (TMEM256/DUF423 family)